MKLKVLPILALYFAFSSCVTQTYYQIYHVKHGDNLIQNENKISYEDNYCKITYNIWMEGGNIGFIFFNKTDSNIYVNLDESFFVMNQMANNYFKNRIFTDSKNYGISGTKSTTVTGINNLGYLQSNNKSVSEFIARGYSTSINEERKICIPPKTYKEISEYNITTSIYRDCILYRYPNQNRIRIDKFSKETSPFVFSNIISYSLDLNSNPKIIKNEFYVSEIANFEKNDIFEARPEEFCKQKGSKIKLYFKDSTVDKFYNKYQKLNTFWKH